MLKKNPKSSESQISNNSHQFQITTTISSKSIVENQNIENKQANDYVLAPLASTATLISTTNMILKTKDENKKQPNEPMTKANIECSPLFLTELIPPKCKIMRQEKKENIACQTCITMEHHELIVLKKKTLQNVLDDGQRRFEKGLIEKKGLIYLTNSDLHDDSKRRKIINSFKFTGWKTEQVVKQFINGDRIITITNNKNHLKKLRQIESIIDLDFSTKNESKIPGSITFLYITNRKIVGYCVVSRINSKIFQYNAKRNFYTDNITESVICGIHRIWVQKPYRRKKVATQILDCIRKNFILGEEIEKANIAFSRPTPDGNALIVNYLESDSYLIFVPSL